MRAFLIALLLGLAGVSSARAAELAVKIEDSTGAAVADAVVTFQPATPATGPIRFPWAYSVAQRNIAFEPFVLIAPVGAEVRFPNLDRVRHHVYSFSEGNRFELQLYGRDETRSHRFSKPGVAAIGCNIHDQMLAYIVVVDTPFAGKSDETGVVRLSGVSGAGSLQVWHPRLRAPGSILRRAVQIAPGAHEERFSIPLRSSSHH